MFGLAFFNPYLLWGLGGATIPILIHLFNRRRFRTVAWAAMEFLLSSSKLTASRLRILQALLLLTRMGIVSLLVLGVARPYLTGALFGGALARSKSSAVIILDNSYSMGLREGNETVFDVAKEVAQKIVFSFERGDSLTYILMGARPRVVTEGNPSPERVKKLIETSELCDETTDIAASLLKGMEILDSEKNTRKELFLITDCQKNGWGVGNRAGWEKIKELLYRGKVKPRIYVADVSRRAGENVMVDSVKLPAYPCGVGKRYVVEATAKSSGEKLVGKPIFTLFLDDEKNEVARAEGSEYKDGVSTGRLVFSVDSPGFHWGKVLVQPDALEADNARYFSVRARRSVPILCVDGVGSPDRFESGIAYLAFAFAPEMGMEGIEEVPNVLAPKVVSVEQFWGEELGEYEIVVLSNVGALSGRMYELLMDYVGKGGAVMIFLGDKVDPVEYSERYASSEKSLLPCPIGPPKEEISEEGEAGKGEAYRISEVDFGHPAMAAFKDSAGGDLTTAKFYRFFTVQPETSDPDVQVVARFTDGSPYIVEKKFGRGRAILFTSSCDSKWSNLPLKPVFLPLMHRLAYYLVSGVDERYNLTVGEKIVQRVTAEAATAPVSIQDPRGALFKIIVPKSDAKEQGKEPEPLVSFEETSQAGIYSLMTSQGSEGEGDKAGTETIRHFAVNVDTEESDLSVLEEEGIRGLVGWKEFRYWKAKEGDVGDVERMRHGKEIWRYLLVGVLCFLVVESLLARQIDKG